jgi:hypothetical protein
MFNTMLDFAVFQPNQLYQCLDQGHCFGSILQGNMQRVATEQSKLCMFLIQGKKRSGVNCGPYQLSIVGLGLSIGSV